MLTLYILNDRREDSTHDRQAVVRNSVTTGMSRSILPLLFVMGFPYQWWQSAQAQSSEMGLLTLAPPASQAATTSDAAAAAAVTTTAAPVAVAAAATTTAEPVATPAPSVVPSVLYPAGNPTINNIDTVLVSYTSPWDSVDLTVQCESGSSKQSYEIDSCKHNVQARTFQN